MDGLPLEERSGVANPSRVRQADAAGAEQPVMHACGHDVHITAMVGTARQMIARRASWSGTLILIAQPAEETISGARAMLQDGLYTRFPKPDYALAFHVAAALPAGRIQVPRDHRLVERRFGDDPGQRRRHARRLAASRRRSGDRRGADRRLAAVDGRPRHQPAAGRGDQRRLDSRRGEEQHHPRTCRSGAHRARRHRPRCACNC